MPCLLVTGGCGFIGSNFIRQMMQSSPDVSIVNFDALTYAGNLANLKDFTNHPRYRFIKGDITDRDDVRSAFALGIDGVIHFAAESRATARSSFVMTSSSPGNSFSMISASRACASSSVIVGMEVASRIKQSYRGYSFYPIPRCPTTRAVDCGPPSSIASHPVRTRFPRPVVCPPE